FVSLLGRDVCAGGREIPAVGVHQSVPVDVVPFLDLADDVHRRAFIWRGSEAADRQMVLVEDGHVAVGVVHRHHGIVRFQTHDASYGVALPAELSGRQQSSANIDQAAAGGWSWQMLPWTVPEFAVTRSMAYSPSGVGPSE